MENSRNIFESRSLIDSKDRSGIQPSVVWMTGLSASGKSTLARELERELFSRNIPCYILDGDNLRGGLCVDLGFSPEDRKENIRRASETARLFLDAGHVVICSFISPSLEIRKLAREIIGTENFLEVFVDSKLEDCERRDPKGLYVRARKGEIQEFTGVSAPYEKPLSPDLHLDTSSLSLDKSLPLLVDFVLVKIKQD